MDIVDALKLIISRSPRAAENALRTYQAVRNNSPVVQARYSQVLIMALADPEASFSPEERQVLADGIESPEPANRDFILRVRLTEAERSELETACEYTGMSMSEYVRRKLFQ
jgi:hypothetical protein